MNRRCFLKCVGGAIAAVVGLPMAIKAESPKEMVGEFGTFGVIRWRRGADKGTKPTLLTEGAVPTPITLKEKAYNNIIEQNKSDMLSDMCEPNLEMHGDNINKADIDQLIERWRPHFIDT